MLDSMDDFVVTISLLINAMSDHEDEADISGFDRSTDLFGVGTAP